MLANFRGIKPYNKTRGQETTPALYYRKNLPSDLLNRLIKDNQ